MEALVVVTNDVHEKHPSAIVPLLTDVQHTFLLHTVIRQCFVIGKLMSVVFERGPFIGAGLAKSTARHGVLHRRYSRI